jgi:SAM-dependent methyltransferase
MPKGPFNYQSVAGDYQYQAMHEGLPMQRFWHKGKLIVWDELISPMISDEDTYPIIEIGCGAGLLIEHLAPLPHMKIGVDINSQALGFLSNRFNQIHHENYFFPVAAFGESLPFPENFFGGVILSEVIEHLVDPRLIIQEAYRILRPGGWCYLTTPNYRSFWPVMEKILDISGITPRMADAQHVFPFDQRKLLDLVKGWKMELITSFYSLSPFLSILSENGGIGLLKREWLSNSKWGMLLACLVRKPI